MQIELALGELRPLCADGSIETLLHVLLLTQVRCAMAGDLEELRAVLEAALAQVRELEAEHGEGRDRGDLDRPTEQLELAL